MCDGVTILKYCKHLLYSIVIHRLHASLLEERLTGENLIAIWRLHSKFSLLLMILKYQPVLFLLRPFRITIGFRLSISLLQSWGWSQWRKRLISPKGQ